MTRVLGVSLAVNGVTEGKTLEQPGKLPRTMAFSNTILRSKWYAQALMESEVLRATTRRMADGRAMRVAATHLDASASALQRNQELRTLGQAERDGECRIVCNVKLFTEGVDVPSLDAVAFLDPRDSQVDVVQAVGRVMRKAPGKRFGYIIVPVVVEPGSDVAAALMRGTEGYQTVGRVLRALQAHDGRLAESPANFVKVYEQSTRGRAPRDTRSEVRENRGEYQIQLDLKEAEQGIYAHVAAASGPDVWYRPKALKHNLADRYAAQRSQLLVPMRLNTVSGRLTGVWSKTPSFGWWVPITVPDEDKQKALAAWWNSTPVRLMLLNRRAQTLTYPTWQLAHLREIRIPKPDNPAWTRLRSAFDEVCDIELLPMQQAVECEARKIIDDAAALACGVEPALLADWRCRLAAEPTITNRRAGKAPMVHSRGGRDSGG